MKSVIIKLGFISFFMIQPYLYPGDILEYFGLQDKVVHDLSISTEEGIKYSPYKRYLYNITSKKIIFQIILSK